MKEARLYVSKTEPELISSTPDFGSFGEMRFKTCRSFYLSESTA